MRWTKADLARVRSAVSLAALCHSHPGLAGHDAREAMVRDHALPLALHGLRSLANLGEHRAGEHDQFVAWCRSEDGRRVYPNIWEELAERTEGLAADDRKGAARLRGLVARLEVEGLPEGWRG